MRRRPNPWIAIPALVMGVLAGALGWIVTDVSCQTPDAQGNLLGCVGWTVAVSIVSFLVVTIGMVVILALVYRSIAEWNEKREPETGSGR
jgi:formate hydrogenlyase subunit 3/multisubunit Na+/H+ antiporter MnhD subunit